MVCRHWDIVLITCFSLMFVGSGTVLDELPQPQNFSLSWDLFSVTAHWEKPTGLDPKCEVKYELIWYNEKCPPSNNTEKWDFLKNHRTHDFKKSWTVADWKEMCISIATVRDKCDNRNNSKALFKGLSQHQDLVRDFRCVYYSNMKMNCTWNVLSNVSDLQLFYSNNITTHKPCHSYIDTEHMRRGCNLFGENFLSYDTIYFTVTATHNGIPSQNGFIVERNALDVKMIPKLNISQAGQNLIFKSSAPEFADHCWKYRFYYKKCNEEEKPIEGDKNWSARLEYDEACMYTVRVQALYRYCSKEQDMDLSEAKYYGKDADPNWSLKAAIIVTPVILSCCLIMALVLFTRHKNVILPKVPEPSRDMFNNNKYEAKGLNMGDLYVPYEEVVEKQIILEPETTFLKTHF